MALTQPQGPLSCPAMSTKSRRTIYSGAIMDAKIRARGKPPRRPSVKPIAPRLKRVNASWLNMVEIEIGVLHSQCLDRRIDDKQTIRAEVAAWQQRRNAEGAQIQWMFTTENAREKLRKAYPVKES
jgi:hypothetical protein